MEMLYGSLTFWSSAEQFLQLLRKIYDVYTSLRSSVQYTFVKVDIIAQFRTDICKIIKLYF